MDARNALFILLIFFACFGIQEPALKLQIKQLMFEGVTLFNRTPDLEGGSGESSFGH